MKQVILLLSLFIGLSSIAQDATRHFFYMSESKVKDMDVFRKNFPVQDAFTRKMNEGVMKARVAHTSETGGLYILSFVDGDENVGKYIANRATNNNKFREANPQIAEDMSNNTDGGWRRSTWIRVNELQFLPADYKMENYNFRKIVMRTVPANEQEAFEKQQQKMHEIELKIGVKYLSTTWRATDGYPTNTYITILADNSILDFYTHFTERQKIRKNSKEYNDFNNTTVITNINRIDHLWRIH
jgi:hypothetical protein